MSPHLLHCLTCAFLDDGLDCDFAWFALEPPRCCVCLLSSCVFMTFPLMLIFSSACCFFACSLCLASVTAFSSVSSGSSCNYSDNRFSLRLTTSLSLTILSCRAPYLQCSARQCSAVMKESANSPISCCHSLNFAHSKITFL